MCLKSSFWFIKDKNAAYRKYKFDAMFVGDDWKGSELFSKCEVVLKKYGSTAVYFPYAQKVSSTKLREKLQLPANPTVVKIEKAEDKKQKKSIR